MLGTVIVKLDNISYNQLMRIGIDCRLWEQTGVGRYIKNLIINLSNIDKTNEYILFVRSQDAEGIKKQIANSKWRIVKTDIRWHSVAEQVELPKILAREKLDLVHFPYFSVPIFYDKPFVVTIHDLIINHFSTGKASTLVYPLYLAKRHAYKFVISQAASKAKMVIVPSNASKEEVVNHLKVPASKIKVIYEGMDQDISNLKTQKSRLPKPGTGGQANLIPGKYFLYVGNAYPHKNLERLIKAFCMFQGPVANLLPASAPNPFGEPLAQSVRAVGSPSARATLRDVKLVLVGKKDYFYRKLEEKNKCNNLIYFGKANDHELADLYSYALALVMPSLMEGFGLPILEAMSLRCPVLASNIAVFKEVAGDEAVYFNPTDVGDIADKLESIILNPESKSKLIEKAYQKTKEFSWEKMAKETLKIYSSAGSV